MSEKENLAGSIHSRTNAQSRALSRAQSRGQSRPASRQGSEGVKAYTGACIRARGGELHNGTYTAPGLTFTEANLLGAYIFYP
eukprot:scaffold113994_cov22-Tisochrysis_lutea.AAC.2